jgi:tryptophan-rich sensory protein
MSKVADVAVQELMAAQRAFDGSGAGLQPGWNPELVKFLTTSVLAVLMFALLLGAILMWRDRSSASQILRTFGVILIVGFATVLLVIGYSNEQLTPIVGLFGAIGGYLLGKDVSGPRPAGPAGKPPAD